MKRRGRVLFAAWNQVASFEESGTLLRVPAAIYAILCGTAATVIHSLIDLPFRSPAILITWALALACAPAFLPRQTQPAVANETPVDGAT